MHAGEVVCGLRDAHIHIICLFVMSLMSENVPGPLPLNRAARGGKLGGQGPRNKAINQLPGRDITTVKST